MTPLSELFLDTEKGRELAQRARVDQRMRAFAGYGIGLLASDATDPSLPRLAAMVLEQALSPSLRTRDANRDVLIAAITAFGLLPTEGMREHVLRPLLEFYAQARGKGDEVAQAHVPPALAAVLGRGGDKSGEIVAQLVQDLEDPERTHVIRQSAAIALGELCDASARHAAAGDALWRYVQDGKDQQTCAFSLIALAHIGGDRNRTALLNRLRSTTTIERPWVALALGVLAHEQRALGVDRTIGRELAWAMKDSKNEDVIAATAIGLGLSGATEAAADVRELLSRHRQRPTLAAHLCTALALLDDTAAVPLLREVMAQSARHPQLLTEAASALVRLGERAVGTELAGLMAVPGQELTTLTGAATALATVGDRRCLPALLDVLSRPSVPDLGRAYAIVAIGGIGDRDDVPLSNRLTRRLNYRATVETLTNQTTGVLDIL